MQCKESREQTVHIISLIVHPHTLTARRRASHNTENNVAAGQQTYKEN